MVSSETISMTVQEVDKSVKIESLSSFKTDDVPDETPHESIDSENSQ